MVLLDGVWSVEAVANTRPDRGPLTDSSARRLRLLGAGGAQNVLEPEIPLVARIFEDLLAVVARQRHPEGPRPRPHLGIVERDLPLHSVRCHRREALDEPQGF